MTPQAGCVNILILPLHDDSNIVAFRNQTKTLETTKKIYPFYMQTLNSIFLITAGVILTLVGDIFLKKSQMSNWWFFSAGIIFYALGVVPVAILFKKIDFGTVFLIWEAATVILALLVAYFYFHESFNIYKGLALVFALCALYFSYK